MHAIKIEIQAMSESILLKIFECKLDLLCFANKKLVCMFIVWFVKLLLLVA